MARNYACRFGEIDLIALDKGTLAFIEVRYRSRFQYGSASASVTATKQQRVIMTAQTFLKSHRNYCNRHCRFDIIAFDGRGDSTKAQWLKAAFYSGEHPIYE